MPDHPTVAQMLPLLQAWAKLHADLSAQMDALSKPLGSPIGGPLFEAVWLTWDAYTDQLSHRLGDTSSWLAWHCHDNDMGRKALEVSSFSRTIKVRTLRQLATVIAGM